MIALALLTLATQAGDVTVEEETPQLAVAASWPAAAAAIAPLDAALRADLRQRSREAMDAARGAASQARREHFPFVQHALRISWQVEGSTPQLISLSASTSASQGGGHSSDDYEVLLWDRLTNRPVAMSTLLDMPALVPRFCAVHATVDRPSAEPCPTLGGRAIAPADTDGNGRFETLRVYMAVNYFEAEGYPVDIPLTQEDFARLPTRYQPAFEVTGERRE